MLLPLLEFEPFRGAARKSRHQRHEILPLPRKATRQHHQHSSVTPSYSSVTYSTLSYSTLSCYLFFLFAWFWSLGNSQVSQLNFLCLIHQNISFQGTGFYLVWVTLYRMFHIEMWSWTDQSDVSMMVLGARLCTLSSTRTTQHKDDARAEVPQKSLIWWLWSELVFKAGSRC